MHVKPYIHIVFSKTLPFDDCYICLLHRYTQAVEKIYTTSHVYIILMHRICLFTFVALGLCCCMQVFSSYNKLGLLCCGVHAVLCGRFCCCRGWILDAWPAVVAAHGLSNCGTWVSCWQHVGPSQTRDGTRVPFIGRWILNHWATREVQEYVF